MLIHVRIIHAKKNNIFNTDKFTFYFCNIAVLVNNTLFFLFGKGLNGNNNPSMFTIDVTSVTNISYVSIFNAATDAVVPSNNNATNGTTDNTGPIYKAAGLSKGVVGGIAAGCVVLVSYK